MYWVSTDVPVYELPSLLAATVSRSLDGPTNTCVSRGPRGAITAPLPGGHNRREQADQGDRVCGCGGIRQAWLRSCPRRVPETPGRRSMRRTTRASATPVVMEMG
jgi:hypothetical protein